MKKLEPQSPYDDAVKMHKTPERKLPYAFKRTPFVCSCPRSRSLRTCRHLNAIENVGSDDAPVIKMECGGCGGFGYSVKQRHINLFKKQGGYK